MMEMFAQMSGGPGSGMMNGWGGFGGPGFMWFGPLFWLIVMFLVIWLLVSLVRGRGGSERGLNEKSPLDILKERYARGEIDTQEYEERRKKL